MVETLADELISVVEQALVELRALDEAAAAAKPNPRVWSIKEILGHLIDSAANNHQRFIRAQQGNGLAFPEYEQDAWVRVQDHQGRGWPALVEFWALYNQHLAHVIRRIPESALGVSCRIGTHDVVRLDFLLTDYVVHLRHHLKQIRERTP